MQRDNNMRTFVVLQNGGYSAIAKFPNELWELTESIARYAIRCAIKVSEQRVVAILAVAKILGGRAVERSAIWETWGHGA